MPQLGATFVPGGFDDYYMPEVVAPSPQRFVGPFPSDGRPHSGGRPLVLLWRSPAHAAGRRLSRGGLDGRTAYRFFSGLGAAAG